MIIDDLYLLIDSINVEDTKDKEEIKRHVSALHAIIEKQNDVIVEFRNSYIRLENTMKSVESRIEYYSTYKKLCEIILDRIDTNPISALWFLYSVRRKITEFNKEN